MERKFLNDVALWQELDGDKKVKPGDHLEMRGVLDCCSGGCQPAIRHFIENNDGITASYESDTTIYEWEKFSHPKLKGTVLQKETNKKTGEVKCYRYWTSPSGKSHRKEYKKEN